jgi:hypothetical protein
MAEEQTLLTAPPSDDTGTGEGSPDATTTPEGTVPAGETSTGNNDGGDQGDQITYALNFPDGVESSDATLQEITAYAKENGLSNEQAQSQLNREIDRTVKLTEDIYKAEADNHQKTVEGWAEEVKNDPEMGGDNFDLTVSKAKRVIDKFGSDKLKEALNESGYGNHPEVVRLFAKISELDVEDTHEDGGRPATVEETRKSILYPND